MDMLAAPSSPPATARRFLAVLGAFLILTVAWVFATPLMGVPDEPAHTIRAAAVARGEFVGDVINDGTFHYPTIEIPGYIEETLHLACFAGQPDATAACQPDVSDNTKLVDSGSSAASNNPVFYAVVGLPSLVLSGEAALYAMRLVAALASSLLLTVMVLALRRQSHTIWPVVGASVGITPMVLFLSGSLNPGGVEIAGAGAVAAILTMLIRVPLSNRDRWIYGALLVLSTVALTSGRTLAVLWLAIIGVACLIYFPLKALIPVLRRPATWFTLAGMAIPVLWIFVWFKLSITAIDPTGRTPGRVPGIRNVITITLESTGDNLRAWVGQFGWLDFMAPEATQLVYGAAIVVVVVSALVLASGRARAAIAFLTAAAILVPVVVQAALFDEVGWLWQGRYGIPLYLVLVVFCGIALDGAQPARLSLKSTRLLTTGAALLAVAQIVAFVVLLRRYVTGSLDWAVMIIGPKWQPPSGWITVIVLYSIGALLAAILLSRWLRSGATVSSERFVEQTVSEHDERKIGAE
jgi:hypothetical protein